MTHQDAQQLLDKVKEGQPIPGEILNEALFMTGDGACWRDIPDPEIEEFLGEMKKAGQL